MKRILLIGAQGSGKSTQAKLLSEFLGVPVVSTGEVFRNLAASESDEGKMIKAILDAGKLVDDKITSEIVKKRLDEDDCQNGFIMDGYPRNLEQVNYFDPQFDKVFYLNVSDEEIIKRLSVRGREDDTPELIKTRLDIYSEVTVPLLKHYQKQGVLVEIDGMGQVEKIHQDLRSNFL
ncbi:nucleoside monophosphate kinase [Candidatus Daviesbacteria bacterium]|nr:nucleoside monophosphate kinase [Candidatus Daviesbacteria bacterium]